MLSVRRPHTRADQFFSSPRNLPVQLPAHPTPRRPFAQNNFFCRHHLLKILPTANLFSFRVHSAKRATRARRSVEFSIHAQRHSPFPAAKFRVALFQNHSAHRRCRSALRSPCHHHPPRQLNRILLRLLPRPIGARHQPPPSL